jgi:hypothetical protein
MKPGNGENPVDVLESLAETCDKLSFCVIGTLGERRALRRKLN